jgi:hypothetical protein
MAKKRKSARSSLDRAERGYRKIAFGKINDAVSLMFRDDISPDELKKLNLNNVAELKQTKDGLEIKFYDRMKALECLREMEEDGAGQSPLYRALMQSVKKRGEAEESGV